MVGGGAAELEDVEGVAMGVELEDVEDTVVS